MLFKFAEKRREIQKLQGFQWTLVAILLKTSLAVDKHY
jgi:hypothetical protein